MAVKDALKSMYQTGGFAAEPVAASMPEVLEALSNDGSSGLSDGVRMAIALDSLGFNMDRLEEDGSYKVSGNDLAFGEGQALGIFSDDGNLDMTAAANLLDTKYEDMSDDQKKALDDVTFLNQNVMSFAQTADGTLLKDTEEGQKLGGFLEKIDGVDDLKDFQDQNYVKQKMTTADIVNSAMKNQDTLVNATIVLDAETMKQFKDYQAGVTAEPNVEAEDVAETEVPEGAAAESVDNSVENVDKSDVLPDGVVKDAMDKVADGVGLGVGAGLGVAGAQAGFDKTEAANQIRENLDNFKDYVSEKVDQIREAGAEFKENVVDYVEQKKQEQSGIGAAVDGSAIGRDVLMNDSFSHGVQAKNIQDYMKKQAESPYVTGVEDALTDDVAAAETQTEGMEDAVAEADSSEVEVGVAESDVVADVEKPDATMYHNDGDTNVTINVYGSSEQSMSMLDMAKQQMEQMGIDMSDEKNPEIPDWYEDMQNWVAEREASGSGVQAPSGGKDLQPMEKGSCSHPGAEAQTSVRQAKPVEKGVRLQQAREKLGDVLDKAADAQSSVGMEM